MHVLNLRDLLRFHHQKVAEELYLVESFDSGIVSEKIQALPVRLPQEFHPRSQHLAIRSILRGFARYGGQKEGFWRGQLKTERSEEVKAGN